MITLVTYLVGWNAIQVDVFSLILWNKIVNNIPLQLEKKKLKVAAYVDDVTILVSEMEEYIQPTENGLIIAVWEQIPIDTQKCVEFYTKFTI